ncbi:MAG: tetratricopeptide repeat protein [Fimbriimonadaceae bacterium]|nr:MAG: tetratricopeptide repeat protein [Fimbriimonadaceae bacterium]
MSIADSDGSDVAVYQDLASANLLRMRGDKQDAIDTCLKILRNYPNNATAHSLLGEIYMEHGELKQAAEWFEMALDLDPNATREKMLLKKVQDQLNAKESAAAVQQLEIKPRSGLTAYLVGMMLLVIAVGALAFFVGNSAGKSTVAKNSGAARPITIPAQTNTDTKPSTTQTPETNTELPATTAGAPTEDVALLQSIKASGTKGNLVISLIFNPALEQVTLTGQTEPDVTREETALMMASDVFVARPEAREAVIRLVENSRVIFVGTIGRAQYDEAQGLSGGSTPINQIAMQAFPNAWHADGRSSGSPVTPPDGMGNATGSPENNQGQ